MDQDNGEMTVSLECEFICQVDGQALMMMKVDGELLTMLVENEVES